MAGSPWRTATLTLLVLAVVGFGAWFLWLRPEETFRLNGSFVLTDSDGWRVLRGGGCIGGRGYDDVRAGTGVVVRDGAGETLATGGLGRGRLTAEGCSFFFLIDVPKSDFYAVSVGRRGEETYSFKEMEERDWLVVLTLG